VSRKARSLSLASRWISAKDKSPPRISWPALETPSTRPAATEPTPAIASTPSAMQAMKTPKPRKPPRSSRQAKRSGIKRFGFVAGASITRPSARRATAACACAVAS
jgi:hypothetical protein